MCTRRRRTYDVHVQSPQKKSRNTNGQQLTQNNTEQSDTGIKRNAGDAKQAKVKRVGHTVPTGPSYSCAEVS